MNTIIPTPVFNCIRRKTSKMHHSLCVGIMTIPHENKKTNVAYIMKKDVDWFEQRGVRVVPIPYDTPNIDIYLSLINGLYIPGGDMPFIMKHTAFIKTVTKFVEFSLQQDEYFPIWGTCFGFELLLFITGKFTHLSKYEASGLYPITIINQSRMLHKFSKRSLQSLEQSNSTVHNHYFGISPEEFLKNPQLRRFYTIISTCIDNHGKTFISAIEGKKHPIYGVQFHPEFQKTSSAFADFFIGELSKNKNKCKIILPHIKIYQPLKKCKSYQSSSKLMCYMF